MDKKTRPRQPEGNFFDKYNSKNIIYRRLVDKFFGDVGGLLKTVSYKSVYEAGCGEGHVTNFIARLKEGGIRIRASDISETAIKQARAQWPDIGFLVGSIYDIQCRNGEFDLVVGCEVLEHLDDPDKALAELVRVSNRYILLSVPNEPIWRIANFLRGKYMSAWGNTPGHIRHWNAAKFQKMVSKHCKVLAVRKPFPWTVVLCEKTV